ncbi:hypothetical protein CHL76_02225 [Marinococcus halophilus]|uniref:Uncharacterized protein n=1 Tax=Marinococcus halophilus TaxID=1371 RepID=A0A510Y1E1_MARHA|nr:hypothetical protein [Marinococcus halophilus]OZT81193.1 hypothetical protein CHL76_02225 [Marinococcus halophilus]GEK57126.1 hypothetical protein MHA01_00310 [Marinococcus halophilus]
MASNYGWSKSEVLNELYPDEINFYVTRVQRDRTNERITELAITQNPHTKDPSKLQKQFEKDLQKSEGRSYIDKEKMSKEDEKQLKAIAREMRENAEKRGG